MGALESTTQCDLDLMEDDHTHNIIMGCVGDDRPLHISTSRTHMSNIYNHVRHLHTMFDLSGLTVLNLTLSGMASAQDFSLGANPLTTHEWRGFFVNLPVLSVLQIRENAYGSSAIMRALWPVVLGPGESLCCPHLAELIFLFNRQDYLGEDFDHFINQKLYFILIELKTRRRTHVSQLRTLTFNFEHESMSLFKEHVDCLKIRVGPIVSLANLTSADVILSSVMPMEKRMNITCGRIKQYFFGSKVDLTGKVLDVHRNAYFRIIRSIAYT